MDAMQEINDLTIERNMLSAKLANAQIELERVQKRLKLFEKAYPALLDEAIHTRERMGLVNDYFENDWLEKVEWA